MIFMSGIIDSVFIAYIIMYSLYIIIHTTICMIYVPAIIPIVRFQRKRKQFFVANYCSKLSYSKNQFESKLENCQTV